jgi:hypothetical protein
LAVVRHDKRNAGQRRIAGQKFLLSGHAISFFRYDSRCEFALAETEAGATREKSKDGSCAQLGAESVRLAHQQRRWIEIPGEPV